MCVLPLGGTERTGAVIAHTDISEYKRMGYALQAKNDELEIARKVADKANRAKFEFFIQYESRIAYTAQRHFGLCPTD